MDIGYYNFSGYPKLMYHATEQPRTVNYPSEEEALVAEGWSATYIVHEWPKCYYGPEGATQNVASPEEAAALPPGWSDTPPANPPVPPVSLAPMSASVPAAGGDGTVTVTITGTGDSGTWTVDPEASATWLRVTAPTTPQSTSGPVYYTADANDAAARTGHLYINGKTFTLDQEGLVTRGGMRVGNGPEHNKDVKERRTSR